MGERKYSVTKCYGKINHPGKNAWFSKTKTDDFSCTITRQPKREVILHEITKIEKVSCSQCVNNECHGSGDWVKSYPLTGGCADWGKMDEENAFWYKLDDETERKYISSYAPNLCLWCLLPGWREETDGNGKPI